MWLMLPLNRHKSRIDIFCWVIEINSNNILLDYLKWEFPIQSFLYHDNMESEKTESFHFKDWIFLTIETFNLISTFFFSGIKSEFYSEINFIWTKERIFLFTWNNQDREMTSLKYLRTLYTNYFRIRLWECFVVEICG